MGVRGEIHFLNEDAGDVFTVETPRFTIGRGIENSLCLPDPSVSRFHAEIIRLGKDFLLRDLGSTNGSYVNGVRVAEQMLNDGDLVLCGEFGPRLLFKQIEDSQEILAQKRPRWGRTENLIKSLSHKLDDLTTDEREEVSLRCVLAEAYINKGKHEDAFDMLSKYVAPVRLLSLSPEFRASVLYWVGSVYIERKQYASAIDALHRSLDYYTQVGDSTGIAGAHTSLGRALSSTGDLLAARDSLHRAMLVARRAGNARLRAEVHLLVGKLDWKEGDLEGARYNWMRAARLAEGSSDALLQARAQLQQAFVLYSEGKLKEAVPAYQAAIDQIEAVENVRFLLKAYSSLSRVLTHLGSWIATERLLEDRMRLARENSISKAEAIALTDLAELRLRQGNFIAAWNVIHEAIERHGPVVYARTQRILGRILWVRKRHLEAVEALEKGLASASKKGSLEEQILIGLELALIYLESGDTARAFEHLVAAESVTPLDPALGLMGRALYTRGRIQAEADQTAEANRCFTQSLSIHQTIGDPFRAAMCHAAIGALRARMDRPESARGHLEEAHEIFTRLGAAFELEQVEAELRSGELDLVEASMTRALSPGLTMTAPLSLSSTTTVTMISPSPHRVLVGEANDDLAALLTRGLEVENYVVERARDGREAFEQATDRKESFDLLVLDTLLEHRSGFDVCCELRKIKLEIPVILLGNRQGVEDKIEALQAGADDFIAKKDMVFEELLAKIEALLR